jgi:hypothetical protein
MLERRAIAADCARRPIAAIFRRFQPFFARASAFLKLREASMITGVHGPAWPRRTVRDEAARLPLSAALRARLFENTS